jgi:hypothetical protein
MKSDNNQKMVRTIYNDRAPKDDLKTRGFQKIPGTGLPKGVRRKKSKSESRTLKNSQKKQRRILRIQTFAVLGVTIAVLGYFFLQMFSKPARQSEVYSTKSGLTMPDDAPPESEASHFPSPSAEEAIALVKQAMAVREPNNVARYFRHGTASPQTIVDFLREIDARDGPMDNLHWLSNVRAGAAPLEGVAVKFKGKERPTSRLALLTPDTAGKWQVDFDAFARTVTPSWADLLENRAQVGLVRVFVEKDFYYNGPFIDEKEWRCYAIASPELKETLRAYCKIGSRQAAALASILPKDLKFARATLEIRRVEGAESRQFEISKVMAKDWVLEPVPFEEIFK